MRIRGCPRRTVRAYFDLIIIQGMLNKNRWVCRRLSFLIKGGETEGASRDSWNLCPSSFLLSFATIPKFFNSFSIHSTFLMRPGDRFTNTCLRGGLNKFPKSTGESEGPPAKVARSARFNLFWDVPVLTDSKLEEVPVPRQNSVDAEVSSETPADNFEVDVRYTGIGYRPVSTVSKVKLARGDAQKHVLAVCEPNWDGLNMLDYTRKGNYLDFYRFADLSVKD